MCSLFFYEVLFYHEVLFSIFYSIHVIICMTTCFSGNCVQQQPVSGCSCNIQTLCKWRICWFKTRPRCFAWAWRVDSLTEYVTSYQWLPIQESIQIQKGTRTSNYMYMNYAIVLFMANMIVLGEEWGQIMRVDPSCKHGQKWMLRIDFFRIIMPSFICDLGRH